MALSEQVHIARVPVDLFGLFKIGDVWHRGSPVGSVAFERRVLTLRYHEKRLGFVEAGLSKAAETGTRWLIPPEAFPLGELLPGSQLVTISDGHYPYRYLVPSLTLTPFYYGGSSELNRALFRPGFGQPTNPVFDPAETKVIGRDLHLHLTSGIPMEDARVIAPWTTDYGIRQVARIYESLLLHSSSGLDGYSRAFPPFLGEERLVVQGIRLATGKYERFLILRIESGSLPVPYDRIILSNPEHAQRVPDRNEKEEETETDPRGGGTSDKKEQKVIELNAGSSPAPGQKATLRLPSGERFRDKPLIERQKQRVPSTPKRAQAEKPKGEVREPTEVTIPGAVGTPELGEGRQVVIRMGSVVGQTQGAIETRGQRSPAFSALHDYLDALDESLTQPHAHLVLPNHSADDGDPCASFFPLKHEGEDAYFAWYYRQVSRRRRRKLLVALANYKDVWFALLEAEHKGFEEFQMGVVCSGHAPPDAEELVKLAAAAAANHCIWEEGTLGAMAVRKQKHTWDKAEEFTATITALFEAMIA